MAKLTRLRAIRERRALTQEELAQMAGINRVTLNTIEAGHSEPRAGTVRKLAQALGVEPAALMAPDPVLDALEGKALAAGGRLPDAAMAERPHPALATPAAGSGLYLAT